MSGALNKSPASGAARQKRYRERRQAQTEELLQKVVEHHRFRARVLAAMERGRMGIHQLASMTGIAAYIIEQGDDGDHGVFEPQEVRVLCRVFPHIAPPGAGM